MMKFQVKRAREANYSPASLILDYANRTPYCGYKVDGYGKYSLRYKGDYYVYDHLFIEQVDEHTDLVTVYMREE